MALVEEVYVHLVRYNKIFSTFPSSLTKQRRLGKTYLSDPLCDGHNVVSTAQLLLYKVLPAPEGVVSSAWPWEYRMTIAACISVAAKCHIDFGYTNAPVGLLEVAFCFMTEYEQNWIKYEKGVESVFKDVSNAEIKILARCSVFSVCTRGPIQRVEDITSQLIDCGCFLTPRDAIVCRNLCVLQLRAVMRHNVSLLAEGSALHVALVIVALRWMKMTMNDIVVEVQPLVEQVLVCVASLPRKDLVVGEFGNINGAVGAYVSKLTFDLVTVGAKQTK